MTVSALLIAEVRLIITCCAQIAAKVPDIHAKVRLIATISSRIIAKVSEIAAKVRRSSPRYALTQPSPPRSSPRYDRSPPRCGSSRRAEPSPCQGRNSQFAIRNSENRACSGQVATSQNTAFDGHLMQRHHKAPQPHACPLIANCELRIANSGRGLASEGKKGARAAPIGGGPRSFLALTSQPRSPRGPVESMPKLVVWTPMVWAMETNRLATVTSL
jgi:hypothetical protein